MLLVSRIVSMLPERYRLPLIHARHASRIRKGTFVSPEPEYAMLGDLVQPGDWAIDIGASVGLYTARLSSLVGKHGRVFAFEPVPESFELLTANMWHVEHRNITLINAAVSDHDGQTEINIPRAKSGAPILGWASFEKHPVPGAVRFDPVAVYVISLDSLRFTHPIKLIKIDVEGHNIPALKGMVGTLKAHSPILIIETSGDEVPQFLATLGYRVNEMAGSPNYVFRRP